MDVMYIPARISSELQHPAAGQQPNPDVPCPDSIKPSSYRGPYPANIAGLIPICAAIMAIMLAWLDARIIISRTSSSTSAGMTDMTRVIR